MASPFNYTVSSSFVIASNIRSDDSDNEYEYDDEPDEDEEVEDISESFNNADMDFSLDVTDTDVESDSLSVRNLNTDDTDDVNQESLDNDLSPRHELDQNDLVSDIDEEPIEHQPKRMKLMSNEEESEENEAVDPNQKCPICLAAWTNVGDHRLCSLRCGHLFGYKCIKHWLNTKNYSTRKCPQCNARASVRHIRLIYANQLTVPDTRVVEKMKKELEESNKKITEISKALADEKKRTKKYKQLYENRTLALATDSDFEFFD